MSVSVFELFKIGIGPSSSHTVGPMKAAKAFLDLLKSKNILNPQKMKFIKAELFGSLALTGLGHGTDKAVVMGLEGNDPRTVNIANINNRMNQIKVSNKLRVNDEFDIDFTFSKHLLFHKKKILPYHTNGMKFTALDEKGKKLLDMNYYSIGGGFFLS